MTLILLLGLGGILACVGFAVWRIYGPQTSNQPDSASEHNGRNWVATDFNPGSAPSASPDSSPGTTDSTDSGA
ncbi:MAG: hypothetical protein J0M24_22785 [Verrucomicrobia bacterium]|nr:hypothetical protein [Verrucomicrobiota bacterium]